MRSRTRPGTSRSRCSGSPPIALGGAFVAGLYARLQGIATRTESTLVLIGGTVFTLCFSLCWTIWMAPLVDMPGDSAAALAQAQAYLSYDDIGWFVLGSRLASPRQ